jgi:predicted membrane chloride channel (bestrophin family)
MRKTRAIFQILNLKSLLLSLIAIFSTWLCWSFGITADFPLTLIATAIVFPLVFSISTAYKRREKALEDYGSLKAHGRALYLAARDWVPDPDGSRATAMKAHLGDLLHACRDLFTGPIARMEDQEQRVFAQISNLSLLVERMRREGLSATECSRCNQYISRIGTAFENIRNIYKYRTPRTLRAFSDFFILVLPFLYGPYFAFHAGTYGSGLWFVMPVLFVLILVGLSNIQDHLENPFDGIGDDDVTFNAEKFVASLDSLSRP